MNFVAKIPLNGENSNKRDFAQKFFYLGNGLLVSQFYRMLHQDKKFIQFHCKNINHVRRMHNVRSMALLSENRLKLYQQQYMMDMNWACEAHIIT